MSEKETTRVGKRGTVVIPARLRQLYGIEDGSMMVAEATEDGILLRPAAVVPVESYTTERVAEFLLNTAVDEADYEQAVRKVREMGLDPDEIDHIRP
ncbi:AbrB/MazE/SpoVT family DNA-binding domain-containing protein [Gemmatimonadota bacterium]